MTFTVLPWYPPERGGLRKKVIYNTESLITNTNHSTTLKGQKSPEDSNHRLITQIRHDSVFQHANSLTELVIDFSSSLHFKLVLPQKNIPPRT